MVAGEELFTFNRRGTIHYSLMVAFNGTRSEIMIETEFFPTQSQVGYSNKMCPIQTTFGSVRTLSETGYPCRSRLSLGFLLKL